MSGGACSSQLQAGSATTGSAGGASRAVRLFLFGAWRALSLRQRRGLAAVPPALSQGTVGRAWDSQATVCD